MNTAGPNARYARYRCRDCEGYSEPGRGTALCTTTSKTRRAGDAICIEGRMRREDVTRWTPGGDAVLKAHEGQGLATIARHIPQRSKSAIQNRAFALKVSLRPVAALRAKMPATSGHPEVPEHKCTTCEHAATSNNDEPCHSCDDEFSAWVAKGTTSDTGTTVESPVTAPPVGITNIVMHYDHSALKLELAAALLDLVLTDLSDLGTLSPGDIDRLNRVRELVG